MDSIIALDHSLFAMLNGSLTSNFFDWLMPLVTDAKIWLPIVALVWLAMIFSGQQRLRVVALALLVSVVATDLISARIIKKAVGRRRPCTLAQKTDFKCRLLLPLKTSKSFPSNHAANTAAFATAMIAMCGIKFGWPFIAISLLVGYSRVYVGVHFPFDVAVGWLVGTLIALAVCHLILWKWPPPAPTKAECQPPPVPS